MKTAGKIIFIVSAIILVTLTVTALTAGIYSLIGREILTGIGCIVGSLITGYASYLLYVNYQHKKDLFKQ